MMKKDMAEKIMGTGTEKKKWMKPIAAAEEKISNKAAEKITKTENIMKTKIIRTKTEMNTLGRPKAAAGETYHIEVEEKSMMKTGMMTKIMRGDTVEGTWSTEITEGISMKNSDMKEKMIADTERHILEKVEK